MFWRRKREDDQILKIVHKRRNMKGISMYTGWVWGYRGHDRMVVGFMTTYAISSYHYKRCDIPFMSRCTRYNIIDQVCQWLSTGRWFSLYNIIDKVCQWLSTGRWFSLYNIIDKVCQWLSTGRWFSLASLVSSTNKTDRQDMIGILLKVASNTIKLTFNPTDWVCVKWY
jgi:hypothetical protein